MHVLFAQRALDHPRWAGPAIVSFELMKACAALGHAVSLATLTKPSDRAIDGLTLAHRFALDDERKAGGHADDRHEPLVRRRFGSYYGATPARRAALAHAVTSARPDAVVLSGIDVLPYCAAIHGCTRVWQASDDQSWRYLSLLPHHPAQAPGYLRAAAIMALYERAHARFVDRVWVVTPRDRRAMRWLGGMRAVDVIPLGVDHEYFRPSAAPAEGRTAVFWGRLDFEANRLALRWFCRRVWPALMSRFPDARLTIAGAGATPDVRQLAARPGVVLKENLPDLRAIVQESSVAVMPFVSTGGLKNKVLEAAALGMPIVCTPAATEGLRDPGASGLVVVQNRAAFIRAISGLWADGATRRQHGEKNRRWVMAHHSWQTAASQAIAALKRHHGQLSR